MNVQVILIEPAKLDDQEDLESLVDIGVTLEWSVANIASDFSIELAIKPDPDGPKLYDKDPPSCVIIATLKNDNDLRYAPRFVRARAYVCPASTGTPMVIHILEPSIFCDSPDGLAINCFCDKLIELFGLERPSLAG